MATEEFTFPISEATHSPIDSPPLWRLSPSASPTPSYKQSRKGHNNDSFPGKLTEYGANNHTITSTRKSCSYIEASSLLKRLKMGTEDDKDEQEEKMDMLWEDLNEEVCRNQHRDLTMIEFDDEMEFGCVPTSFKLAKSNNTSSKRTGGGKNVVKSNKKPSAVMLMKVLKKLFAVHQFQLSAKKRSW